MDQDMMDQFSQIVEVQIKKGFEKFESLCKTVCQQCIENDHCGISYKGIRKMWDFEDGKDGRDIMKIKGKGFTSINEMRPIHSIFDPPGPLSVREKVFAIFNIENSKLGATILREMTKKSKKFEVFLVKVALYARSESTYEYADDLEMYKDIFG